MPNPRPTKPSRDVNTGSIANPKTPIPGRNNKPIKPKPSPTPSTFAQRSAAAEAELRKLAKAGAIKDLNKTRDMIAKKYGIRPNGYTN